MNKRGIAFFSLALSASFALNTLTMSSVEDVKEVVSKQDMLLNAKMRSVIDTDMKVEELAKQLSLMESQINSLNNEITQKDETIESMSKEISELNKIKQLLSGGSTFK